MVRDGFGAKSEIPEGRVRAVGVGLRKNRGSEQKYSGEKEK